MRCFMRRCFKLIYVYYYEIHFAFFMSLNSAFKCQNLRQFAILCGFLISDNYGCFMSISQLPETDLPKTEPRQKYSSTHLSDEINCFFAYMAYYTDSYLWYPAIRLVWSISQSLATE